MSFKKKRIEKDRWRGREEEKEGGREHTRVHVRESERSYQTNRAIPHTHTNTHT